MSTTPEQSAQPTQVNPESEAAPAATSVQSLLASLVNVAATQAQQTRELHKSLKRLAIEIEKEQKKVHRVKPKRTVVQKPVNVQPAMATFLQGQKVDAVNGGYTRQVMMKAVSAYIKNQKLQSEENKKQWKPDTSLAKLFNLDKKQLYSFMNINGLLSKVIVKA
jgi:chromatin remodeling complex protein RSC6